MRHRPIGIGVQGLADAFMALRLPFDSPEARQLNLQIFETIYHAAIESSCDMAREHAAKNPGQSGAYPSYKLNGGSPASQGLLQYDLWNVTPTDLWDWAELKDKIAQHGLRNSLVCAPMPTASTSQILGNNEAFEPYTSCVPLAHPPVSCRRRHERRADVPRPVQEHLHAPRPRRRVPDRQPVAPARPRRPRPVGRRDEEHDHRAQRLDPERAGHPGRAQAHLQDGVGDLAEDGHRPRGRPWRLHRPEPEPQRPPLEPDHGSAHEHALLRLEEGPQDRHGASLPLSLSLSLSPSRLSLSSPRAGPDVVRPPSRSTTSALALLSAPSSSPSTRQRSVRDAP